MKPLKRPRNGPKNGSVSSANQEVPDINELSAPICTFCYLGHKVKTSALFQHRLDHSALPKPKLEIEMLGLVSRVNFDHRNKQ